MFVRQVLVQVTSKSVPDSLLHLNHMTTVDFISVLIELFDEASTSGAGPSSLLLKTLTILHNLGSLALHFPFSNSELCSVCFYSF